MEEWLGHKYTVNLPFSLLLEYGRFPYTKKGFGVTLTSSGSDGTLDKKSNASLLGMALGLRIFLVNLLMPHASNR